jgi:hypothetical protein
LQPAGAFFMPGNAVNRAGTAARRGKMTICTKQSREVWQGKSRKFQMKYSKIVFGVVLSL